MISQYGEGVHSISEELAHPPCVRPPVDHIPCRYQEICGFELYTPQELLKFVETPMNITNYDGSFPITFDSAVVVRHGYPQQREP